MAFISLLSPLSTSPATPTSFQNAARPVSARSLVCRASLKTNILARDDLLGLIEYEERGLRTQQNAQKRLEILKAIDALGALGSEQTTTDENLSATWRMLWTTEKEQLFIIEKAYLFGTKAGDILQVSVHSSSRFLFHRLTSKQVFDSFGNLIAEFDGEVDPPYSLSQRHLAGLEILVKDLPSWLSFLSYAKLCRIVIDVENGTLNNVITFPPTGSFVVDSTIEVVSKQRVNFRFIGAALNVRGRKIPIPPFGQGWFESVYLDDKIRVARDIRGDYLVVDRAPYEWKP